MAASAPLFVSLLALVFTIFSFWWMNWRPGQLEAGDLAYFAAGKATEGASEQPNVVIVTLPLILLNSGARPIVIESLRLTSAMGTDIGTLDFEGADSHLGIVPDGEKAERDYFFLPVCLKPNEVIKKNIVFERRTSHFVYRNLLYHLRLEAKLTGRRDWLKIKDVELDFRNDESISVLGLNLVYQVFRYHSSARA